MLRQRTAASQIHPHSPAQFHAVPDHQPLHPYCRFHRGEIDPLSSLVHLYAPAFLRLLDVPAADGSGVGKMVSCPC